MIDLTVGHEINSDVLHEQLQPLQTFTTTTTSTTLGTDSQSPYFSDNIQQPFPQPIIYSNGFQPMSSQQKAAMPNAALINFFGNAGTVSSIMQTVQQTQQQSNLAEDTTININDTHLISTEQWQQLTNGTKFLQTFPSYLTITSPVSIKVKEIVTVSVMYYYGY